MLLRDDDVQSDFATSDSLSAVYPTQQLEKWKITRVYNHTYIYKEYNYILNNLYL